MKTRKLRAGSGTLDVTLLGFGGAPLGNLYTAISDDEAQATLDAAWDAGISTYDLLMRREPNAARHRSASVT